MSVKLACVTCTGDRVLPLSLCRRYMERSTVKPDVWLVVDDGADPSTQAVLFRRPVGTDVRYVKRARGEGEPKHTLPLNTAAAIWNLPGDIEWVVFWEDDDWYSPEYLQWVQATIEANPNAVMVGQSNARYYRVMSREYQCMFNDKHASLCATAIHRSLLPRLLELCSQTIDPFVDIHLWCECVTQGKEVVLQPHAHVIGIKELPGRRGTTYGWRGGPFFNKDVDFDTLREWVGVQDAAVYAGLSESREGGGV